MTLVVIFVAVLAVAIPLVLVMLLMYRKRTCPGCRQRAARLVEARREILLVDGHRRSTSLQSYRCASCSSEWVSYNRRGLISRAAYEEGARDPIPTATARSDK